MIERDKWRLGDWHLQQATPLLNTTLFKRDAQGDLLVWTHCYAEPTHLDAEEMDNAAAKAIKLCHWYFGRNPEEQG